MFALEEKGPLALLLKYVLHNFSIFANFSIYTTAVFSLAFGQGTIAVDRLN